MKKLMAIALSLISFSTFSQDNYEFYSTIDNNCEDDILTSGDQSASLTTSLILSSIAIKSIVGLAKTSLTAASESKTHLNISTESGSTLFKVDKDDIIPSEQSCIRFWYGKINRHKNDDYEISEELKEKINQFSEFDISLNLRNKWKRGYLIEDPKIYGEVAIHWEDDLLYLVPTILYVNDDLFGKKNFFRKKKMLDIKLDLIDMSNNSTFSSLKVFERKISDYSIYKYGADFKYEVAGPFVTKKNENNKKLAYKSLVAITLASDPNKYIKALSEAFNSEEENIIRKGVDKLD